MIVKSALVANGTVEKDLRASAAQQRLAHQTREKPG
jgi:hypothetical protein